MHKSDQINELVAAMAAAQAEMGSVQKGGWNDHNKYKYAQVGDILNASKQILLKHGIIIVASAINAQEAVSNAAKGNRVFVNLSAIIAHSSGQWIEIQSVGEGCDTQDKATYKAITGARKYALTSGLNLATTDEPEADEAPPVETPRTVAANKKLAIPAAGVLPADPTVHEMRLKIKKLCADRKIPLTKVGTWVRDQGYHNLDGAPQEVREQLVGLIEGGKF